nr:MAG TPA: hypothetical protein [Caudoviricetes sp.]DAN58719.1 MAG TPA: hypothetical protein [Caudoviricetes sp.]
MLLIVTVFLSTQSLSQQYLMDSKLSEAIFLMMYQLQTRWRNFTFLGNMKVYSGTE